MNKICPTDYTEYSCLWDIFNILNMSRKQVYTKRKCMSMGDVCHVK